MNRSKARLVPVANHQHACCSAAKGVRLLQYCIEHRGEVARRGIDDLQYLGGRGLLLQRFARLGQQPRVFHRNDRLRREILYERDFLFGEWSHLLTVESDHTEKRILSAQRDRKPSADTHEVGALARIRIGLVLLGIAYIGNMNDGLTRDNRRKRAARRRSHRAELLQPPESEGFAGCRGKREILAVISSEHAVRGTA